MSHQGLGTPRDDVVALGYLSDALTGERYVPEVKYELSHLYRDGPVKWRDPAKAFILLTEALPSYYEDPPRGCSGPTDSAIRQYKARNDAIETIHKEQASLYARLTPRQKRVAIAELAKIGIDPRKMISADYAGPATPPTRCVY